VKEAVGEKSDAAMMRETFPKLIKRAAEIEKEYEDSEKPQWTSAVYTVADPDEALDTLSDDEEFEDYEGEEVFPRTASPFTWPLPEDESGERIVAIGAGRVVLSASSPEILAASRPALEAKLGDQLTFLTETNEPIVLPLRRSWEPKT